MLKFIKIFICLGIIVIGYIIGAFYSENPYITESTIVIEQGTSVTQIAKLMCNKELFFNDKLLALVIFLQGKSNKLKFGEYVVQPRESAAHFVAKLTKGKVTVHHLIIPSGLTNYQIVGRLNHDNRLKGEITLIPEDYLFPDTYYYTYGMEKEAILKIMQTKGSKNLQALWEENKHNSFLNSPQEVLILASIIEKETNKIDELPRVAGVFINRLKNKMKLQADPTVIYAATEGKGPLNRKLTKEDLKKAHTHNTYYIEGLPPSPICNPSAASIRAVMYPLSTEELYFVADKDGRHVFANSLKEHNNNVNNIYRK